MYVLVYLFYGVVWGVCAHAGGVNSRSCPRTVRQPDQARGIVENFSDCGARVITLGDDDMKLYDASAYTHVIVDVKEGEAYARAIADGKQVVSTWWCDEVPCSPLVPSHTHARARAHTHTHTHTHARFS